MWLLRIAESLGIYEMHEDLHSTITATTLATLTAAVAIIAAVGSGAAASQIARVGCSSS